MTILRRNGQYTAVSTDKGQRKEESPIMAVVEMDHMEADGGMDEVEERGHAVTEWRDWANRPTFEAGLTEC